MKRSRNRKVRLNAGLTYLEQALGDQRNNQMDIMASVDAEAYTKSLGDLANLLRQMLLDLDHAQYCGNPAWHGCFVRFWEGRTGRSMKDEQLVSLGAKSRKWADKRRGKLVSRSQDAD